ncbi:MAG: LrgB family protein [Anaerolineae bacterium]
MRDLATVWDALSSSPLLWLTVTLITYRAAEAAYDRLGFAWLNPVLISIVIVVATLLVTQTSYEDYFAGVQLIHLLLGPATVALAVPLYHRIERLRQMTGPIVGALLVGSCVAVGSAVAIGWLLGASPATLLSLAPKSVTTPIAMGVSEKIGGLPSLTAVLVILTGIVGAITAEPVLNLLRVEDHSIRGFAVGVAAHGIGTARAFQMDDEAGAFSGLGMGLNGILTAVLVPIFVDLVRFAGG